MPSSEQQALQTVQVDRSQLVKGVRMYEAVCALHAWLLERMRAVVAKIEASWTEDVYLLVSRKLPNLVACTCRRTSIETDA